jgi:hypothetical protein
MPSKNKDCNKWYFTSFGRESEAETFLLYKNTLINHILYSQTNNGAAFVPESETSFGKAGKLLLVFLVGSKMAAS